MAERVILKKQEDPQQETSSDPIAQGAPKVEGQVLFDEIGSTGLTHWSGRVNEEWLRKLQYERGVKTFKEMSDNDPVVGGMLFAIDMLMRQVSWAVTAGSDMQQDVDAAEFVESCLYDMSRGWKEVITEITSFLTYGWSYHEITYKKRVGPDQVDSSKRSNFTDGRLGWRKISVRAQDTLNRWVFSEDGSLMGMVQNDPRDYSEKFIPIEKSLLFRTTTKKGNPEGRSILRNSFRPWFFKKRIEEIEGIGIERDLAGLPVAYVPSAIMSPNASADKKAVYSQVKRIVRDIRRDEQEGIVFPGDRDERGNLSYELKLLSTGGSRQFDTSGVITRYDQRIAMTVLADFILLGHDKVGSFALSSDKTALFATAIGAFLDSIAEVFNTHAIPRLLRINGMKVTAMPELNHGDIETPDIDKLGNYIQRLSASGVSLFPDSELENALRSAAGLPIKPEEENPGAAAGQPPAVPTEPKGTLPADEVLADTKQGK